MAKGDNALSRHWWFILYPESAPTDWLDLLLERMLPFAVSPLHDRDTDKDGNLKKPHYHIMFNFDGNKTYNKILEITRSLNQPIPTMYDSPVSAFEYLYHGNNPEKAQYNKDDVCLYNGFKVPVFRKEKVAVRQDIIIAIRDNNIVEYCQLVDFAIALGDDDFIQSVFRDSYALNTYLMSRRYAASQRHKV